MTQIVNSEPTYYDEATDVTRLNELLDAITAKRFVSSVIFVQSVRAACDLHGITLPILDIEGSNGPTVAEAPGILYRADSPTAPQMYAAPTEGEYVFHCEDGDGDISEIYLYMVADKDDEGLYECYAQLVNEDELHTVLNMELDRDYPEVEKETFLDMTRHARGDAVQDQDDTPPEM